MTCAVGEGIDCFLVINEHEMREDQAAQMSRLAGMERANVLTS